MEVRGVLVGKKRGFSGREVVRQGNEWEDQNILYTRMEFSRNKFNILEPIARKKESHHMQWN